MELAEQLPQSLVSNQRPVRRREVSCMLPTAASSRPAIRTAIQLPGELQSGAARPILDMSVWTVPSLSLGSLLPEAGASFFYCILEGTQVLFFSQAQVFISLTV
eukprot:COSAG04_NODE_129_length_24418_cov_207.438217_7_plen_104_part_00